jgi:hypothetical protein
VLTQQWVKRYNTGRPLASEMPIYIPRTIYLLPLRDQVVYDPVTLASNRIHLLVTSPDSLYSVLQGLESKEQKAVAALQWHEASFAHISDEEDDKSQALLADIKDELNPILAERLVEAEMWVRLVRVYLSAPMEKQLMPLISFDMKPSRKPRPRGYKGPRKIRVEHPYTGKKMKRAGLFHCTFLPDEICDPKPWLDLDKLMELPGCMGTRMERLARNATRFSRVFQIRFQMVPELIMQGQVVSVEGGFAFILPNRLWGVRVKRKVEFSRPVAGSFKKWIKGVSLPTQTVSANLLLPQIDELENFAPPCIVSMIKTMRGGHIGHNERLALLSVMHKLGYEAHVIRQFCENNWGPRWDDPKSSAQRDIDGLADSAARGEIQVTGCDKVARMGHCEFADIEDLAQSKCFQRGHQVHGIRSEKPVIYSAYGYLRLSLPKT